MPVRSFVIGWLRKLFAKTVSAPIMGSVFFGSTTTSLSSVTPRDVSSGPSPKSDSVLDVPGGNSTSRKNRARPPASRYFLSTSRSLSVKGVRGPETTTRSAPSGTAAAPSVAHSSTVQLSALSDSATSQNPSRDRKSVRQDQGDEV